MSLEMLRNKFHGFNMKKELRKLLILTYEDLGISFKSKKLWIFIILMLLPSLILVIAGFLFFIPENQTLFSLHKILSPKLFIFDEMVDRFRDSIKDMYGIAFGYWLNIPIVIVTAIYTSEFIAGERAKGSFDLFATKPILRSFLVISKMIAFAIISYLVSFIVYLMLFLTISLAFFGFTYDALVAIYLAFDLIHIYILVTWMFVLTVASITILFSSLTKRPLFATFGTLAYFMGYGIGVSLISTFVPGTLGSMLSEQLSYINVQTVSQVILSYWLTGKITRVFQLTTIDPNLAIAFFFALLIVPFISALLIIETKDLL